MNPRLAKVVAWLRAGYPTGLPDSDYVPLVALLRRRLTDEEVKEVARALRHGHVTPAGKVDIGVEVTKVTDELPSQADMERVATRLQKKGWPLQSWDDDTKSFDELEAEG